MDDSDDDYVDDYVPSANGAPRRRPLRKSRGQKMGVGAGEGGNSGSKAGNSGGSGYSWEDEYHRSWDVVREDAGGSLAGTIAGMVDSTKRLRLLRDTRPVQRGIIRNLVLIIDLSAAMGETDMRPTRLRTTLEYASEFITEYFSQNPISQMAIVSMRDSLAQLVSPLDGNPTLHAERLNKLKDVEPSGAPSLQNALEMARAALFHVPQHCTREVLIVMGALMSSDPGDITKTVNQLVTDRIRVRIIGLAAQVAVCNHICVRTNFGNTKAYNIVLNEQHFRQLMLDTTVPLSVDRATARSSSTLVEMGFPSRTSDGPPVICVDHGSLVDSGYNCPRCKSRVCTLPIVCPVCQLTLILSTHLARSYHHLFPLQNFVQIEPSSDGITKTDQATDANPSLARKCFACLVSIGSLARSYNCPKCHNQFCVDCDVFCHETLHNCPGCEASAATVTAKDMGPQSELMES